jgi:Na+/proline symporter
MKMTNKIRSAFAAMIAAASLAVIVAGSATTAHADLTGPKAPPPPPSQSR